MRYLWTSGAVGYAGPYRDGDLASGYTHLICRKVRIEVRSSAGYTFLWRLNFLSAMSKEARRDLLERIAQRTDSAGKSKGFFGFR